MKLFYSSVVLIFFACSIFSQTGFQIPSDVYLEHLYSGSPEARPYLNYRTLSDKLPAGNNFDGADKLDVFAPGAPLSFGKVLLRLHMPSVYASWNSTVPYGQNDGSLWQGRGFNSSLIAGFTASYAGFEATFKPQLTCSQNTAFELIPSAYSGPGFEDKADTWGYYGIGSIDAPQRFGDLPLYAFSWGESEIRYSYKTLTVGFGTQSVWLGPARINPILHSDNASPYPKIDIGLRRQEISLLGYHAGDVEFRSWWGKLSESEYFDNDSANDHNLLTAVSFSFAPSFMSGFTFGFHRTMLSDWEAADYSSVLTLLWPFMKQSAGSDERDQRASLTFQYELPKVDLNLYLEWGRNDYSPSLDYIIRYPFHTQGYTVGGEKGFVIPVAGGLDSRLLIELTNLESSRDLEFLWKQTFYGHHKILQGYTNEGQWLGAGMGTGGNSQYLALETMYPNGIIRLFFQRVNPDNDYVWFMNMWGDRPEKRSDEYKFRADLAYGIQGIHAIHNSAILSYRIALIDSHNYDYQANVSSIHRYNVHLASGFTFRF